MTDLQTSAIPPICVLDHAYSHAPDLFASDLALTSDTNSPIGTLLLLSPIFFIKPPSRTTALSSSSFSAAEKGRVVSHGGVQALPRIHQIAGNFITSSDPTGHDPNRHSRLYAGPEETLPLGHVQTTYILHRIFCHFLEVYYRAS